MKCSSPRHAPTLYALFFLISLSILAGCKKPITESTVVPQQTSRAEMNDHNKNNAEVAVDWYHLQLQIILNATTAYSNTVTIRLFAYSGVSLYESLRDIIPHSNSLHSIIYQMPAMPERTQGKEYIWEEVANANMASITRKLFPVLSPQSSQAIDSLEAAYNQKLSKWSENDAFTRSQLLGQKVAQAVFDFAKTDLFDHANDPYIIPVFPGAWQPFPATAKPAAPYFGNARPFLQMHSTGLATAPPYPYSTIPGSDFYNMVKDIYDVSNSLTTDQANIALFWNDVGALKGYTPSGHAINILNHIITREHLKLGTAVIAYAKAGMGMWDAAILCWRSKYNYNQERPVTYIRANINPTWLPLIPTPSHPEYPAAHAYITTSTMVAIAGAIGDKHYIDDHTYDFLGYPNRTFTSLYSIGVQSGMSRRYGGIHYLPSINTGISLGKQVGTDIGRLDLGQTEDGEEE